MWFVMEQLHEKQLSELARQMEDARVKWAQQQSELEMQYQHTLEAKLSVEQRLQDVETKAEADLKQVNQYKYS